MPVSVVGAGAASLGIDPAGLAPVATSLGTVTLEGFKSGSESIGDDPAIFLESVAGGSPSEISVPSEGSESSLLEEALFGDSL
ncbi:hypothetical protein A5788_06685 [Gordonia sp. 852002-50816_SCH5313054-c]|nr:hypothetical protein A5785_00805 [Gordonia sp. 852002-50395_SCH5434458]OBC10337.1 hypothetical protein A5786_05225 [Gordonia sp. 852002-50816_SCH5313054-a]OBC20331.1 hypothetical protein A5788_06685 [Gordonia sp. 852002-50816_SCH5313054-c]